MRGPKTLSDDIIKTHENGYQYRELHINGLNEPLKIFNSNKAYRLEGETYQEYKIRQKFVNYNEKEKRKDKNNIYWVSWKDGTYVKSKK